MQHKTTKQIIIVKTSSATPPVKNKNVDTCRGVEVASALKRMMEDERRIKKPPKDVQPSHMAESRSLHFENNSIFHFISASIRKLNAMPRAKTLMPKLSPSFFAKESRKMIYGVAFPKIPDSENSFVNHVMEKPECPITRSTPKLAMAQYSPRNDFFSDLMHSNSTLTISVILIPIVDIKQFHLFRDSLHSHFELMQIIALHSDYQLGV